jgi:small conductance mechanosensitive channel
VDVAALWEQVQSAFGLDSPQLGRTVAHLIQVIVVLLITFWLASWSAGRIRREARARGAYGDVASVLSRTVAFTIVGIGIAISLATLGVSPTAIAAVLGAFTLGISVSLQDIGRSFVTGLYLLIERPFRIGDRVRIGESVGRVEEIGIRVIHLRDDTGDRIMLPSTLVFSSVVENASRGNIDRQSYRVDGVDQPIAQIEEAVVQALAGLTELGSRPPAVAIVQAGPEGTQIDVTVEYDRGRRIDGQIMNRLRVAFPEATVALKFAAADS